MPNPLAVFIHTLSDRWRFLIGNPSDFTLEARVFHSISLGIVVLVTAYIPYDLFAGLYVAAPSCLVFAGIFGYEYYRSRFRGLPHRSLLFGLSGLVLLSVNYFANSGIEGSTDLIWPVYLLLLLTICPYRYHVTWVLIYLVVFGLVHVAEYLYPGLVQYPFRPGQGQFTDRITAFPIPVIGMTIVISLFKRNYDKERATVAQRDAEKARLLSILSHDLRAPFIQVGQYLELLEDASLSVDQRARMEHTLHQANDQALTLVTNLLYWSRSQLNGVTVNLAQLKLADTLENTLRIAQAQAMQKNIMLTQRIDPAISVIADVDMLQLVVRNLLQNAIKFTLVGGTISVDTDIVQGRCRLSVSDTGVGITDVQLKTLFSGAASPAYGTANEKGVGLGLQLCREFVEHQHGHISVESKPGEGSRFIIELPLVNNRVTHN
jgi:two-component system sensor histidine kinase/response regulator